MIHLQQATILDFEQALTLIHEYYEYDGIEVLPGLAQGVQMLLDSPSLGVFWFLSEGPEVVGYATLTYGFDHEIGGRLGVLTDLFLREGYRGRGLGTMALGLIEEFAWSNGLHMIELVTQPDNERARAVYAKRGFCVSPRIAMVMPRPQK